jgi:hypothetical protein
MNFAETKLKQNRKRPIFLNCIPKNSFLVPAMPSAKILTLRKMEEFLGTKNPLKILKKYE